MCSDSLREARSASATAVFYPLLIYRFLSDAVGRDNQSIIPARHLPLPIPLLFIVDGRTDERLLGVRLCSHLLSDLAAYSLFW